MNSPRQLTGTFVLFALAIVMCGCASIGAPVPPSLELPKPPTDLRAVRKGNKVYLTWSVPTKTTDRQNLRRPGSTRICRSLSAVMSQCDVPVGNIAPAKESPPPTREANNKANSKKVEAGFIDTLPPELQQQNPTGMVTYAVEPFNLDARSAGFSNQVQVALAPTLPPPPKFDAQLTSDGVVLTWECETLPIEAANLHFVYRIHRHSPDTGADVKLADEACPGGRYQDHSIEWQKNYEYRIEVVTFATLGPAKEAIVEGDDSQPQRLFSNDTFPPAVPGGLQAVYSGPGQALFIDLVWAPDTDADLAGYNVYRQEDGGQLTKVNSDLVKSPAFRDTNVSPGKTYVYAVSALDLRGNESARSEEASETVPKD